MKTAKILLLCAALSVSISTSQAITNTVVSISGTNVVLAWPSYGYESYLIQYRHTLDSTDSWSTATNDYPANGTNQTTFTVVPEQSIAGSGGTNGESGPPMPGDTNDVSGGGSDSGTPGTGFYRVYHIPDWLADFSDYTFDGPTFIPVDFAAPDAPVDYVDSTTVLINGQPTDYAQFLPDDIGGTTYWGMGVYFDRFPNGTNTIQLLTTVRQSDVLNDQTPYMTFSNAPQNIVINNLVASTNWDDLIWNNTNYTFRVQTIADVDWEIDIYDVYGYFVNDQTGHTDDGNVEWTWDLTDYTGASRADPDADPFFYPEITITGDLPALVQSAKISPNDTGSTTRPLSSAAAPFPSIGGWIVCYMDNYYNDGTSNYIGDDYYYTNSVNAIVGGPAEWSIPVEEFPIKYGRNYSQTDRNLSWTNLESFVYDPAYRNLYYFGHGAPDSIGGDINTIDADGNITGDINLPSSHAFLTSQAAHDNIMLAFSGIRPYRFAFLDGCDTANGHWPQAFGIVHQEETIDYYNSSANTTHSRPSTFVGWDTSPGGQGWGTVPNSWRFRTLWMGGWANGFQTHLDDTLSQANTDSEWVDQGHFSHLKEYGYKTMMFQEFNRAGNWPQ